MFYDELLSALNSHFFIIFKEHFVDDNESVFLDRFVAKHPLLRPELIVVNDQLHGFKKMCQQVASLEKFPIHIECEGVFESTNYMIHFIDISSEVNISCESHLESLEFIAKHFSKTIRLDVTQSIGEPHKSSLIIQSKLSDFFQDDQYPMFMANDSISSSEIMARFDIYLGSFIRVIKLLDELIVKNKPLSKLNQLFNPRSQ